MDRIFVTLRLTVEEIDSLMQHLEIFRDDDDARHLQKRIYEQQHPEL